MSELLPYQKRVIDEELELNERIEKLEAFIDGETYPTLEADEQDRLDEQLMLMKQLANVLGERIANFKPFEEVFLDDVDDIDSEDFE